MNREDLSVAQKVMVYNDHFKTYSPGWVTRVARKYVTISNSEHAIEGMGTEYVIETQRLRGDVTGTYKRFFTMDQYALLVREQEARAAVKEMGISASYGGPTSKSVLSVEELEAIVELIRRMRGA